MVFNLIYLLVTLIIGNIADENCKWNIPCYGTVDLSPLSSLTINTTRSVPPWTLFQQVFTPCSNYMVCKINDEIIEGMQIETYYGNPNRCHGVISEWDNGATQPIYEINKNNENQIVFNYPLQQNSFQSPACINGRIGQYIFICDLSVDLYDDIHFYQDPPADGICHYHTQIRTKYACITTKRFDCIWKSGSHVLNISSIAGKSLNSVIPYNTHLHYVYTPCTNTLRCTDNAYVFEDDLYAMAFIFNLNSFNCNGYISIWDNGIIQPQYLQQGKIWQFIYENGEKCGSWGEKTKLIVNWFCNETVTTPILKVDHPNFCEYFFHIYSILACG